MSYLCFNDSSTTEIYTLSLHDALPILLLLATLVPLALADLAPTIVWLTPVLLLGVVVAGALRSEEHTSELQSRRDLVCRLLLEKKNVAIKVAGLECVCAVLVWVKVIKR